MEREQIVDTCEDRTSFVRLPSSNNVSVLKLGANVTMSGTKLGTRVAVLFIGDHRGGTS